MILGYAAIKRVCEVFVFIYTLGTNIASIWCDVKTGPNPANAIGMTEKLSQRLVISHYGQQKYYEECLSERIDHMLLKFSH